MNRLSNEQLKVQIQSLINKAEQGELSDQETSQAIMLVNEQNRRVHTQLLEQKKETDELRKSIESLQTQQEDATWVIATYSCFVDEEGLEDKFDSFLARKVEGVLEEMEEKIQVN